MGRITAIIASVIPLIFTTISIAFIITATTSKEWATQKHFDPADPLQSNWKDPLFILYRSPFIVCDRDTCLSFKPYGFNQTSCELYVATQNDTVANIGDERLCQQIHFAGNLSIASTTFIGIGLLLVVIMTLLSLYSILVPHRNEEPEPAALDEILNPVPEAKPSTNGEASGHRTKKQRRASKYGSPALAPFINATLIIALLLGAACAALAQFYGILAFVQSAPDNGAYAVNGYTGGSQTDFSTTGATNHQPWVQGKAITVFGTVAWFSACIAAGAAAGAWRVPGMKKVI